MVARRKKYKKPERPGDKYLRQFKRGIRKRGQQRQEYPANLSFPVAHADPPASPMPEFPLFFGPTRPGPACEAGPRPFREEEEAPSARLGQPTPLSPNEPIKREQLDSPPEMICPLHGEPCLGPHCAWFDRISQCSITNLVEGISTLSGQISGLRKFLEYILMQDEY